MTWNPPFNVKLNKDLEATGTVTGSKFVDTTKNLLSEAVLWFDAAYSGGGQTIRNLGYGGRQLDGQNGSTSGADSNDALHLNWPGNNAGNYVYTSGVSGSNMRVDHEAAFDITGDVDLIAYVKPDTWTPAVNGAVITRSGNNVTTTYRLGLLSTGRLFFLFGDGSTAFIANSSAVVSFTDGSAGWIRATRSQSAGQVTFYTSTDGTAWDQLGATQSISTNAAASSTHNVTIGQYSSELFIGHIYRAQVLDGIDGTTVLDVDCSQITSGSATSFTALTGQTVLIFRPTSGRKSVAVTHPCWLFGTDDYMEVADNALLDFGASDDFTVLAVVRQWAAVAGSTVRLIDKINGSALNGWALTSNTSYQATAILNGGSYLATPSSSSGTAGSLSTLGFVKSGAASLAAFRDGNLSTVSTDARPDVSNALSLRIGTDRGVNAANTFNGELAAVAVFRRALTAAEIAAITSYYQARLS